jgi:RNA polymerase sigma-70 factor (ECF subfamily)
MNISDEQLIADYLKGQESALEELVARHLNAMYNFVFKYVHIPEVAEDVTQEAFVKIWKNIRKFDGKRKFKTWAYTIAKNTALDHLRQKGLIAFSELENVEFASKNPLPEESMDKLQDMQVIGHMVSKLPSKYRQVVTLYYNDELNFREIAQLLSESINTIKTRHRRALIYLKQRLSDDESTPI